MKKVGNINNIPIVQGRNNEIKNQIKAEINIDGTLSFKKRNSLGELTPLTYINIQGNNAKSRRKVGELFNKSLISSPTRLLKKEEILVQKSNEGIILGIKVNNGIKIISKNDFFTITALASGDIQISIPGNVILQSQDGKEFIPFKSISYSKDLINWKTEYPKSTIRGKEFDGYRTINIPVNKGDKVYLKGDALCWYTNCNGTSTKNSNNNLHIASTAKFSISGNILSLFYEDNFKNYNKFPKIPSGEYGNYNPRHFPYVFYKSTFLYDARELKLPNDAPELCYYATFQGCTSLKFPMKSLPALSPKMMAYTSMFQESGIVETPEILAEEVEASTFSMTFYNCKSLTKCTSSLKPKLLYSQSYNQMFKGCTSLIKAPEIQATHHDASGNYHMGQMFSGCTSLTSSPSLKIQTLGKQGYYQLFYGCKNLNKIEMLATDVSATGCLSSWVNGVASAGIFIKSSTATWDITGVDGIPSGWIIKNEDGSYPQSAYLCFTSTGDSTISMTQKGTPNTSANKVIQYKLNTGQWQTWDLSEVSLHDGDKMYLKSDDEILISESDSIYKKFTMTGSIAASGNIMSLLNFSTTLTDYAFYCLFNSCAALKQAPTLPATTLAEDCYYSMFKGCTSLVQAPELPATTLDEYCYYRMFQGCTSLTTAPELPATTLADYCYTYMFYGCSKLTQAPALPATTLGNDCYDSMFRDCSSLTKAPELPATTLAAHCYSDMFYGCTNLTTAPALPATTLVSYCYYEMFKRCTNLNYVKAMFTDMSASNCVWSWLNNVSSTGTFIKSKDATWTKEQAGIPTGWTVQTA